MCRYEYVEYPVGTTVRLDDCNSSTCTCSPEGELVECGGTDIGCSSRFLRRCSDLFPDVPLDEALPGDPLQVQAVLTSGFLSLSVTHGGGCAQHDYGLCLRDVLGTNPLSVDLVLIHDAHDDECDAQLSANPTYDIGLLYADNVERNSLWSGAIVYGENRYVVEEHRAESCDFVYPPLPADRAALSAHVADNELCATVGVNAETDIIGAEAARCIAQEVAFEAGLEEWSITLACDQVWGVIWTVSNVTQPGSEDGPGRAGDLLIIDAQSGEILKTTTWETSFAQ